MHHYHLIIFSVLNGLFCMLVLDSLKNSFIAILLLNALCWGSTQNKWVENKLWKCNLFSVD